MRTLILASLSLSLVPLVPLAPLPSADACGVPEPTVFQLSSHYTRGGTRTFVLTGEQPTTTLAWRQLAPGTYDGTRIADAAALATPATFTLVGASGARVVTTRSQAYLEQTWTRRSPTSALEIEVKRGEYVIALAGKHSDAKWIGATQIYASNGDTDWVKAHGIADAAYLSVNDLGSRDLQAITVSREGATTTLIRSQGQLIRQFAGHALGIIEVDNERFIATADDNGKARALWMY